MYLSSTAISLLVALKLSNPSLPIFELIEQVPYVRLVSSDLANAGFQSDYILKNIVYNNLVLSAEENWETNKKKDLRLLKENINSEIETYIKNKSNYLLLFYQKKSNTSWIFTSIQFFKSRLSF